ncbi:MAG: FtsX-like permease family protein, partial [Phycisphaerales bacterium]
GVDTSVVAFTFVLSMVTAVVFGLAPSWAVSRVDLNRTVRDTGRSLIGPRSFIRQRWSVRRLLVVTELSLAAALLTGAGLLMHSFWKLTAVDPGFSPENVLSFQLPENRAYGRDMDAYRRFYEELGERIAALPGVESAGGMSVLPLAPGESFAPIVVEGYAAGSGESQLKADARTVLWDYFETMKIPVIAGRCFDERDSIDSPPVAIVDETFAERVWPGESPIGKRIRDPALGGRLPWLTVVGVVGSVKRADLESVSQMTYYQPYSQWAQQWMYVAVRTSSDPEVLVSAIAGEVWALDKDMPLLRVATMDTRIADALARRRFSLHLLGAFAAIALGLAVAGLYGVMACTVGQSTREIGIRMALGARQSDVMRVVLCNGMALTGIGLAIGLAISLAATRVLRSLLYEVATTDPVTFIGVPLLLAAVALFACYIPARRAAKVDPMAALRCE